MYVADNIILKDIFAESAKRRGHEDQYVRVETCGIVFTG
jgi:hypothetical protein